MDIGVKDRYVEHGAELIGSHHFLWRVLAKKFGLKFLDVSNNVTDDIDLDHFKPKRQKKVFKIQRFLHKGIENMKKNIQKSSGNPEKLEDFDYIDVDDNSIKITENIEHAIEQFYLQMSKDAKSVFIPDPIFDSSSKDQLNLMIEFDKVTLGDKIKDFVKKGKFTKEEEKIIIGFLNSQLLNDNGISADQQSYLFAILVVRGGGGDSFLETNEIFRCKQGNQELANAMAKEIGKEHIHLSHPVEKVVTKDKKIYITCKGKKEFVADYVVLSTPPTTLDDITFEPKLQVKIKNEVKEFLPDKSIQTGKLFKYIMKTKKSFWYEKDNDLSVVSAKYGEWWNPLSSDHDKIDVNQKGLLTIYSYPLLADEERDIVGTYDKEIMKVYGLKDENFKDKKDENDKGYSLEIWHKKPYSQCAFSAPEKRLITSKVGMMLLNLNPDGLNNPRILFAGEHCAFGFTGFMEGALLTGARCAKQIDKMSK